MKRSIRLSVVIALIAVMTTGCAGLSLFSSNHTHNHDLENSAEIQGKIRDLERRIAEMERREANTGGQQ